MNLKTIILTIALTMTSYASADAENVTLTGSLEGIVAIGGETTGLAIVLEGTGGEVHVEVDTASPEVRKKLEDLMNMPIITIYPPVIRYYELEGFYTLNIGVERGSYPVFMITDISIADRSEGGQMICGLGGSLMYHPVLDVCFQSLSTCQTGVLSSNGFVRASSCN